MTIQGFFSYARRDLEAEPRFIQALVRIPTRSGHPFRFDSGH